MSENKYKKARGTRDIMPDEARLRQRTEIIAREIFELFGFEEIVTPTFETAELFIHTTGDSTDIVEKEMYLFEDKKGRKLSLRPEGTPGVVRAYLENNVSSERPVSKYYYCGQMFRYERPQEGRYREFRQVGVEYFGIEHPAADAEVISMMMKFYRRIGITETKLDLNSIGCSECRKDYRKKLFDFVSPRISLLCDDCKVRLNRNPLRILDCKTDQKYLIEQGVPVMKDFLCNDCKEHYKGLKSLLETAGINFAENPYLVRGLDYYTRTVFELKSAVADVLAAGGRYDYLVEQMGGAKTPAVGFALGLERTISAQQKLPVPRPPAKVMVITADNSDETVTGAFLLSMELSENNISVIGPFAGKSLKSQMRFANTLKISLAVIIGGNELKEGKFSVKDMKNNSQNMFSKNELLDFLLKFDYNG